MFFKLRPLSALMGASALGAAMLFNVAAHAQTADRIAVVRGSDIVILNDRQVEQTLALPDFASLSSLVTSPDGSMLAAIGYREDGTTAVQMVTLETGTAETVAENTASGYPVSFTQTGDLLYAMQGASVGTDDSGRAMTALDIHSYSPANRTDETLATVSFRIGCGGGSLLPTDLRYTAETGGPALMLAATPFGILYSPDCTGVSVALLNLDMRQEEVFMDLGHIALSPDRTQIAGIIVPQDGAIPLEIVVVNLADGEMRNLAVNSTPDRLAWSADGTAIYYSTQAFDSMITLEGTGSEQFAQFVGSPSYPRYTAILSQVSVETGEVTDLFAQPAFTIGRILPVDGAVYAATIANLDAWANAVADGTLDLIMATNAENMAYVPVELWRINPETGEAALAASDAQQAILFPSA